ncbi:MAG: RHS repeat-associated core domain-containing protein, partial [Vulcanimicrobiota bacterium]
ARLGRFLSRDPISFAGGLNLYGYVGGNPVNGVDPAGLQDTPIPPNYRRPEPAEIHSGNHIDPHWRTPWSGCGSAYNCHAYTFHNKKRDPSQTQRELDWAKKHKFNCEAHQYNLDPLDDIQEQGYRKLRQGESVQIGDVVLYGIDVDNIPGLNYLPLNHPSGAISEVTHSGRVIDVDPQGNATLIRSKWGDSNLTDHHPRDVPSFYGPVREYYTKRD